MREPVNKQRSRGEWEQLMARFDANGMTQSAFCTQQNVAYRSFCYWRKRLRTPEAVENPAALIRKLPYMDSRLLATCHVLWSIRIAAVIYPASCVELGTPGP